MERYKGSLFFLFTERGTVARNSERVFMPRCKKLRCITFQCNQRDDDNRVTLSQSDVSQAILNCLSSLTVVSVGCSTFCHLSV